MNGERSQVLNEFLGEAVRAVSCALELQELVNNPGRSSFTGEAMHLRIRIGMHSGPVVAGNLGGSRRMDFTEIGDRFRLEKRKPAALKGMAKRVPVFNVPGPA